MGAIQKRSFFKIMNIKFSRNIPVKYKADVVVVGGGIAGVCAAIAASQQGCSVILIERFAVMGGNATSGGVAAFCGDTAGQGAVFDMIIAALEKFNAIIPYKGCGARIFNHEILAFILQELLLANNIKLLLHAKLADSIVEDGKIKYAIINGASELEAVAGGMFIDCTGEACLTHSAGFDTMKGRDGDHAQLPMSLMFFVRHVSTDATLHKLPDGFLERFQNEAELPMTSIWPNGPGSNAIKIKVPLGDSTDTESFTEAEIRARRNMIRVIDFYQREKGENWILDHCSPIIGIREGRRSVGEYILTVDDLRAGRKFDDAIAKGVFYLDGHGLDDDKRTYILPPEDRPVPPYQIPFRSLVVKDASNLLVAGRCFSADQLALSSARVMTTGAMLGQAAGYAAAICVEKNVYLQDLDYLDVRQQVEKTNAILEL